MKKFKMFWLLSFATLFLLPVIPVEAVSMHYHDQLNRAYTRTRSICYAINYASRW